MGRPAGRHRAHRARTVPRALGLTVISALIPGSGFVMGGRAKLGAFVMTLAIGLCGLGVLAVVTRREQVLAVAVNPNDLLVATGALIFLAICWITIIISSHRLIRPATAGPFGRAFGSAFVGLVCFAIAAPMAVATQSVMAQRDLVSSVFASEGKSKSATREKVDKKDPWAKRPRLNILLLGADDGAGREGTRTDTVMVASIDTRTGDTALISLSRNWMRMPFPKDSPLHDEYPNGFWDPSLGSDVEQQEYYLDAMYRNIPELHHGILGESDNEGADVLKVSVGEALGLKLHYYMQVNLEGFRAMIDALGGIKLNVNYRVPIGGDYRGPGSGDDVLPHDYIEPGPNQKMLGARALWFARGRYGLTDTSRQERQRCTIQAIVSAADPGNVVTKYQAIAKAGKQLLRTDIPVEVLPAFVELGLKVKNAKVVNVDLDKKKNFPNGRNPDYEAMQELVEKATQPRTKQAAATPKPTTSTSKPKPATTPTPGEQQDLKDACAYHPDEE
ncbi:MAG: LCP family protein [Kribbellaceae bacterium]|nr:LCP family protein [Kribbellaceae bacterium]